MTHVQLPWPPKELSPNSRKRHRYTKDFRNQFKMDCFLLTKAEQFKAYHLDITFHPPNARKRDLDNMLASIKYGLDGMAEAMNIDDSEFSFTIRKGEPQRPNGCVIVTDGDGK